MSLPSAFEIGLIRPVIQEVADTLAAGITVNVTPKPPDPFIGLPGVTGYFPMSIVDTAGKAVNHAKGGLDLSQTGTCAVGYDGNAYRQVGQGTHYLSSNLDYALTGLETYIDVALRGFTIGGWFWIDSYPSVAQGIVSKFGVSSNYGYALISGGAGVISCYVSLDGSALTTVSSATSTPVDTWVFLVGRFVPSTSVDVFVNGQKTTNVTAIPASCFASTQAFEVGRYLNTDTRTFDGRCRDVFLCRTALTDVQIENLRLSSLPPT